MPSKNKVPKSEHLSSVHPPEYSEQLASFHAAFEPELRAILRSLPLRPTFRVLDIACGDGFYTRRIAEALSPAGRVVGIDASGPYLKIAEGQNAETPNGAPVEFLQATIDALPFPDGHFDFVWCAQSFLVCRSRYRP